MASPNINNNNALEGETKPKIQEILINIPEHFESLVSDECCIYKVPSHLFKLNEEAYTPKFISIGPIHSKDSKLRQENQKQRYFHAFYKRLNNSQALALKRYRTIYLEQEKKTIRDSYSELVEPCNDNDFMNMILLDSVFIMELFLRNSEEKKDEHDPMFTTSWICKAIQRDLLLLENQIPMFVLEKLYNSVLLLSDGDNKKNHEANFLKLAFKYFEDFYPQNEPSDIADMIKNYKTCKHFTDLIRFTYLPRKIQTNGVNPKDDFTPYPIDYHIPRTATRLNEAGVSFEKVQGRSYLDIKFHKIKILSWFLCFGFLPLTKYFKARLQIPQLKVYQITECVLRNLIALEQCHYSDQPFICNYVSLIDSLIHTHEDVELLVDKEAIVHELGSHTELATLVNCLCRNIVVSSNYYGKTIKKLNSHYNNCWMHYMGMLRSVYFRDPWRFSSSIVGFAVFLFAIFNFLRVIGVFHP
ncbi:UPF0481 protein At3g47200-like [Arachis stenosperma]|uniref:UPF0481 protein At3g47200-like n=1 Tax=Arachis stenosperma TaxID=217475 RepID=UPI0025AC4E3F|nr:UPF0481 protein At3g47200-like [Arachis stenosperma]